MVPFPPESRASGIGDPSTHPVVWYPMLGVLALEEIVEVPVVAAVVLGRLLVSGRREQPEGGLGPVVGH